MIGFIRTIGYLGMFAVIFAESGLLIGFFLPGDSLLFTAGFLASQAGGIFLQKLSEGQGGQPLSFSLPVLLIGFFLCAVIGDNVGYWFGNRVGQRLFQREDSMFFHKKNVYRAQEFYEKHGGKPSFSLVLSRLCAPSPRLWQVLAR